ncbi:GNAT family N-acetyltransferase [Oceanirhabdus sp. W0125-5]|uniref:GNAT family N-acetyltransferase n=1 Tax=Oceanirhabdus sp. W0125-5 TaxID=2999116 RepID=UPI0022F2DEEE|nr:GNAT family N-acetyltransferase [Oceanirhabdus sp. W0125-5]WBW97334.1 GNAT family N-acetyltransferase [Oceanirhabdus sp. W0125-5]
MLNHVGTQRIETERLILRRFKEEDAHDMYNNWASDTEVTRYLSWPAHSSVEVTKKIIEMWLNSYNNQEHYQWAIELKENGEVIGTISLIEINNKDENCEVGYCIGKEFWNKGILTEALSEMIKFAFSEIGFQRIAARHNLDNPASGRVMEKCNLSYEGTLRKIARDNCGNLVDCKYYSILKDEYYI